MVAIKAKKLLNIKLKTSRTTQYDSLEGIKSEFQPQWQ